MHDLIVSLRSLSQGTGFFDWSYDHLQEVPTAWPRASWTSTAARPHRIAAVRHAARGPEGPARRFLT
jgi:translation elongation factor EF-G